MIYKVASERGRVVSLQVTGGQALIYISKSVKEQGGV